MARKTRRRETNSPGGRRKKRKGKKETSLRESKYIPVVGSIYGQIADKWPRLNAAVSI